MKTAIKTLVYAAAASMLLLACNDITGPNTSGEDDISSSSNTSSSSFKNEIPAMDSRVVSYQRIPDSDYNGFTTDKEILKSYFPHILNGNQAESECNYFALHFRTDESWSYEILSQDMIFYMIKCTWKERPPQANTGIFKRAMLICDDKAGTLRKSIDLDSMRFYNDPDWECESGKGGPNWEEMYF